MSTTRRISVPLDMTPLVALCPNGFPPCHLDAADAADPRFWAQVANELASTLTQRAVGNVIDLRLASSRVRGGGTAA